METFNLVPDWNGAIVLLIQWVNLLFGIMSMILQKLLEKENLKMFLTIEQENELIELYHLAPTALADKSIEEKTPYHRMLWASSEYAKAHPECTSTRAYKTLCYILGR